MNPQPLTSHANPEIRTDRLLLFLRYPEPGHSKTRLIPALGAAGAAQLQRQMAEYLLRKLQQPDWQVQVHFTGASVTRMRDWLGPHLVYKEQKQGDLGDRLSAGFRQGFQQSRSSESKYRTIANRTIAIGADCPDITTQHIQQAFEQLTHHDMVLGPATDGGYYLIGLRQSQAITQSLPRLFQNITWSTNQVFQQTQANAQQCNVSCAQLETLSDIDRPADLAIWQKIQTVESATVSDINTSSTNLSSTNVSNTNVSNTNISNHPTSMLAMPTS